jgi:hypothetical protein
VVNSVKGQTRENIYVGLQFRGSALLLPPASTNVNQADGSFEIRGVVPGSYVVYAQFDNEGQELYASQSVEVGAADVEDVQLVITSGVDLPGRVHMEGTTSAPITGIVVWLSLRGGLPGPGVRASLKEDGSFLLKNVNGEYDLSVAPLPDDCYLKSARLGTGDALENGVSTGRAARGDTLELVISAAGGRMEGAVLDRDGQGVGGAVVALIPRVRSANRLYKAATTDPNGRFTLRGIAPGEYKVFAWEDVEPNAYRDPDFLRAYEERGETIRVEEGGRPRVELKVIPAESPSSR